MKIKKIEKNKKKPVFKASIQIFLMIMEIFAFSYLIYQSDHQSQVVNEKGLIDKITYAVAIVMTKYVLSDKNLVSADVVNTCSVAKDGTICQEFPAASCKANCNGTCYEASRDHTQQCKLGTCYDPKEGTCAFNSPSATCTSNGGVWYDKNQEATKCQKGCCMLNSDVQFYTQKQCENQGAVLGIKPQFKSEIQTELGCLVLSKTKEEGACVYEKYVDYETTRACEFITKSACAAKGAEFHSGYLCSSPELNTTCVAQDHVDCVEGRDEVYWFDSCGNRENIFSVDKTKSFNAGKLLSKNDSCQLFVGGNFLANQQTCGNCNFLLGSKCGKKTATEFLAGAINTSKTPEVVCRDLSCDDSGVKRQNGESWCVYQGAIGVSNDRSVDIPGSRHFRKVCINGDIQTEPCADYRNEICVQSNTPSADGSGFTSAACRINNWQTCLNYNQQDMDRETGSLKDGSKCASNPDCFVKKVEVGDKFKFSVCAPRYPPGFNLDTNGNGGDATCSIADLSCTSVEVKRSILGGGGWQNMANKECETEKFTEQLNDLCMSAGDCGASTNKAGKVSQSYSVTVKTEKKSGRGSCQSKSKKPLSGGYLAGLAAYKDPVPGQFAPPGNLGLSVGAGGEMIGIPSDLGKEPEQKENNMMGMIIQGVSGIGTMASSMLAPTLANALFSGMAINYAADVGAVAAFGAELGGESAVAATAIGESAGAEAFSSSMASAAGALGGALMGAGAGMMMVSLFMSLGGMSAGYTQAEQMGLMAAGAIGGGLAGAAIGSGSAGFAAAAGLATAMGIAGGVILAAVLAILLIDFFGGAGTVCKHTYKFSCDAWEAPTGGADCGLCGKDGLPCSPYTCNALGQSCELINEGTEAVECIDSNPNDITPPVITPLNTNTSNNYPYSQTSELGTKVVSNGGDGCIQSYTRLMLGVSLNEVGQCRMDKDANTKFENMDEVFGSGLFTRNQTITYVVPSLEDLGVNGVDPTRRGEASFFIKCVDKRGNVNARAFNMRICVSPSTDRTPPTITLRDPINDWLPYNATSQIMRLYLDEPATCRWGYNDTDYDSMGAENKTFACVNGINEGTVNGWLCQSTFPIIANTTTFNVRCKDQPWFEGQNETARNSNKESYKITLTRTARNLQIDSVTPDNETIKFRTEPATINMVVRTSGGVDGTAECKYWAGSDYVDFYSTGYGLRVHENLFDQFTSGDKEFLIKCNDQAGNVATHTVRFKLRIDTFAPVITRVYDQGGNLVIVTDEPSTCYIDQNMCEFDINNSTEMAGTDVLHTYSWNPSKTAYLKCIDNYQNEQGGCSLIVKKSN